MIHIEVKRGDDSMSIEVDDKETAMELVEQFFDNAEKPTTTPDLSRYEPPQTDLFGGLNGSGNTRTRQRGQVFDDE